MSSSDDDSNYEASLGGLDTSDESESSSEEYYSTDESDNDEEIGLGGRDWYRLRLCDDIAPAPPRFPFEAEPGVHLDDNPITMSPFDFFSL